MGTIRGGSATICSSSPTTPVRLEKTRMLSRVLAFARSCPASLASRLPRRFSRTSVRISAMMSSVFMCAYQTSSVGSSAASRMTSRYSRTAAVTISRRSSAPNPRSRPAISRLAVRRFRSHSHGPGSVSSKSLTSKMSWRSGEPNTPKFIT